MEGLVKIHTVKQWKGAIGAAAAALCMIGMGCAAKDVYWTRDNATEKQFRVTSRRCNQVAVTTLANESGGQCRYNTEGRGSVCGTIDPNDPAAVDQEKRRKERRLRFVYGECMEGRGWTPNSDERGFKGRY